MHQRFFFRIDWKFHLKHKLLYHDLNVRESRCVQEQRGKQKGKLSRHGRLKISHAVVCYVPFYNLIVCKHFIIYEEDS